MLDNKCSKKELVVKHMFVELMWRSFFNYRRSKKKKVLIGKMECYKLYIIEYISFDVNKHLTHHEGVYLAAKLKMT